MNLFEHREDVEEWLGRLDYDAFWSGIAPFELAIMPRTHCDEQIAAGIDKATVLYVLKSMARLELIERFRLKTREPIPSWARH